MTPKQAWKLVCKQCAKTTPHKCETKICQLSDIFKFKSTLKRIKAHCLDCAATDLDQPITRDVINCVDTKCPLHPYRLGKNPNRKKRAPNPDNLKKLTEARKLRRTNDTLGEKNVP